MTWDKLRNRLRPFSVFGKWGHQLLPRSQEVSEHPRGTLHAGRTQVLASPPPFPRQKLNSLDKSPQPPRPQFLLPSLRYGPGGRDLAPNPPFHPSLRLAPAGCEQRRALDPACLLPLPPLTPAASLGCPPTPHLYVELSRGCGATENPTHPLTFW